MGHPGDQRTPVDPSGIPVEFVPVQPCRLIAALLSPLLLGRDEVSHRDRVWTIDTVRFGLQDKQVWLLDVVLVPELPDGATSPE